MGGLNRLPGFKRGAPGLEWSIWKRLPAVLAWGTAVPLAVAAAVWFAAPVLPAGAEDRQVLLTLYRIIGLVVLHWTLVLTVAIGCAIVILMKGPAFVADPYPLPERDAEP